MPTGRASDRGNMLGATPPRLTSGSTLLAIAGCLLAWALPASGQVMIYGVDTSYRLYSINPTTEVATLIGSTGKFLEGLALSPGGQLYGTDDSGYLYTINATTGAATLVGSSGQNDIEALFFSASTLYGITFSSSAPKLIQFNLSTGATTTVASLGSLTGVPRAATAYLNNTVLFTADGTDLSTSSLYSLNVSTGATTLVGTMAIAPQFAALSYASNGVLYGFGSAGQEWSISPTTASVTLLGNTGSQFWLDAVQSVPEPPEALLLALGCAGIALIARVRRHP